MDKVNKTPFLDFTISSITLAKNTNKIGQSHGILWQKNIMADFGPAEEIRPALANHQNGLHHDSNSSGIP